MAQRDPSLFAIEGDEIDEDTYDSSDLEDHEE
jgi:hypothetical protein